MCGPLGGPKSGGPGLGMSVQGLLWERMGKAGGLLVGSPWRSEKLQELHGVLGEVSTHFL